ncbi:MAG TPA: hypothetical protein VGP07_03105 [Polyangia bacterium]
MSARAISWGALAAKALPVSVVGITAGLALFAGSPARGQQAPAPANDAWAALPSYGDEANAGVPLIPPNVEGPAFRATSGGGYCYVGPHPVDTRVSPGYSWDGTPGQHFRPYPPIDNRLFALRDGCYYFTGDPRDFGFAGQTYAYYGAHPVLDRYGGGWCFMMGPHTHLWAPWSPYFTVVGSWNYWHGPFDPFFWAYWPYYSFYYRSYYAGYYGGGRFYRGGGGRVAPSIRSVPAQSWRGNGVRRGPAYRGTQPTQAYRSAPAAGIYRGSASQSIRPVTQAPRPNSAPAPVYHPSFSPPERSLAPSHVGGGLHRR